MKLIRMALGLMALSVWFAPGLAAQQNVEVRCDDAGDRHAAARGVAFVVVLRGRVVCERYDDGTTAQDAWTLASGAKSFTPVLLALLSQDGLVSIDQPASEILPEWRESERRAAIRPRDLLNQSSGLSVRPGQRYAPSYQEAVEERQVRAPGQRFEYGPTHFEAFGELARRQLHAHGFERTPAEYLHRRFFGPLGIEVADWRQFEGQPLMSEGVRMTARSWARFGVTALNHGEVGGHQFGDPVVWDAMFQPSAANPGYGLGWWLMNHPDAEPSRAQRGQPMIGPGPEFPLVAVAAGAGNQRLYVIESLDLVIVRMTRGVIDDRRTRRLRWSDRRFLETLLVFHEMPTGDDAPD